MLFPKATLLGLAASAVLALSACAANPIAGSNDETPGDLRVVATTTQVADFTRNIVGDTAGINLTQLIQANQSSHSYDPSAADLTALAEANVLVINGVGLEEWLDDAIDASGFHGVTIHADAGISIQDAADKHGTDAAQEASHDHAGGNPHIWTAVGNVRTMTRTITAGLAKASPAHAAAFEAHASAYDGTLAELDTWIRTNVDRVPVDRRLLVSNHDAFGYFTAAYGITYVGSIIPSFDDNAEPSAAQIDQLVADIRKTGVKAVFSEASINPKAADTIAKEAHVEVYSGADALYGDSLGPAGSPGDTYIHSQVHNVSLILKSWGVTPSGVPPGLRE
ncbi:metal ABC transporter substrate-binding protein [Glaciibacter sp. 2TAF33]|uniref:metal ABC transporter substrate-binding protein n=1 Tax=Glaciibacter sp. 2TAF33 TaxID=3233015 RepID=UPI003F91DD0A